jgi:hypothetical protein
VRFPALLLPTRTMLPARISKVSGYDDLEAGFGAVGFEAVDFVPFHRLGLVFELHRKAQAEHIFQIDFMSVGFDAVEIRFDPDVGIFE